jgi:alpha-glucosidase
MTVSLRNPPVFRIADRQGPRITLKSADGFAIEVFVLEDDIFRVLFVPRSGLRGPRSWAIAAGQEGVPETGRDRFDASGFTHPDYSVDADGAFATIATSRMRVTIDLNGFSCRWDMKAGEHWVEFARDRPTQAYNFGWWGADARHYLVRRAGEKYYGLGEKSGVMDRAGRRLRFKNQDAMGYDAERSDPLYKHIPFYITHDGETGVASGLFYDTYADCAFDFGAERSQYHGIFRSFQADSGDLDYYMIAGPGLADVTRRFTWLTGRPFLPPRWAFGYSGSTMSYTDAPNAQARMQEFVAACRQHDILCDSFHLSSGYTSIGPRRYVFHWNLQKFPDPDAFIADYRAAGIRLCANIKPCLLDDHPLFAEARDAGLLVMDESGEPSWVQFWGGVGAYLDFTNPSAQAWWLDHVGRELLDRGIEATWNDNNEFEIESPTAIASMFGSPSPARESKPLQTMLMLAASQAAQKAHAPDRRPFLVSRSGAAGMQRYAQTWSGDNATSWESLRYNIRMGLGLALSGVSNSGHDIGGFSGPRPDAELFVRWVEAGVFMPRFSIHSWNDDGSANEPWMHPQVTPIVRDLLRLRYQLLPYIYDLAWRHHQDFEPIIRPAFHEFPDDPATFEECDELMFGQSLLSAAVVAPGATTREVRPPAGANWIDFWTGRRIAGGELTVLPARPGKPPLLVREGSAIAMNVADQTFDRRGDHRAFAIFAPIEGRFDTSTYEDDGESEDWRTGGHGFWQVRTVASQAALEVELTAIGPLPPAGSPSILLRPAETRMVTAPGWTVAAEREWQDWRRIDLARP